ncbi:hypothetical protein ACFQH5_15675 [Halomonas salifodinae]|uniref:DUF2833 domain-containing protein n=1 Tax=Halomonas salifodinae TaxID=438745 RepID=A0ABW2F0L7_9GAMM
MVRAEIRPATLADADALAPRMRQADRDEIWAASRQSPGDSLRNAVRASRQPLAGVIDGELACLLGVVPQSTLGGTGAAWMLGSEVIERHPLVFLRHSRPALAEIARGFNYLHNWVDARNTVAIRWLAWLGFTIHDPEPFGVFGMPFHHFEMRPHV